MARCLVVGAGPAGLTAAWRLQRAGVEVTVLERHSAPGGRTRTLDLHGVRVNSGASFLASFYDATLALCRELDVALTAPGIHPSRSHAERQVVTPSGTYPWAPSRPSHFVRFPPVPLREKARIAVQLARLAPRRLHLADVASLAPLDDTDAETWARRTMGDAAYEYFVRSAIEPFFYMDAGAVSAAVAKAIFRHAVHWGVLVPARGMGTICDALAERLDVRLDAPVSDVRAGDGVTITTAAGAFEADAAIVAVPPPQALPFLDHVELAARATLEQMRFTACVLAFLGYDRELGLRPLSTTVAGPGRHPLVGLTALREGGTPGLIPAGREVVSILARDWRSRELLGRPDAEVADALRAHAAELDVDLPEPDWFAVVARDVATAVPAPGMLRALAALPSPDGPLHLAGDWMTGSSTVEGAVRTGERAADAVIRRLGS